jgi:DNA-binding transcriptional ArsR family regulator
MGEHKNTRLDEVFAAISDGTRRAILARLAQSDARVTELASAFPISLNSTSKHNKRRSKQ